MRVFRYIPLLLSLPFLLVGCTKELQDDPTPIVTDTAPFSVTVHTDPATRASFDGSDLGSGNYVFADGDKLYITGHDGDISGELTLASGAGTGTATFEGTLSIINNYEPSAETILSATLVGASQVGTLFTITDHQITAGPTYPSSVEYSSSLTDLVQNYSHFTASFTYNVRKITLTQQTVFMDFVLELYRSALDISGPSPTVQVDIKSSNGNSVLHSVTAVPVEGSSVISRIEFTSVFPAGTALQGAQMWIDNNGGIQCEPNLASDLDLAANHYYRVLRSAVEDFTVEARNSGASVTFNYVTDGNIQYRTYSGGVWTDWLPYSSTISLSAGEKVSFRGQRTSYTNNGSTPLITVTNPVYIYGDIMSLMCNANWVRQSSVGANAFKQAFKSCANINIHPDKDLFLSAETLDTSCYESMFQACTSLTKTPILPATTLANSCYSNMFYGCTSLASLPANLLPATTLENAELCYNGMFQGCTGLTSLPAGLLPATTWEFACYRHMFYGCSALATVPSNLLPAMALAKACYALMFFGCTAIITAPDLPAITPQPACYFNMFRANTTNNWNVGQLKYIKCMLLLEESQRNSTNLNYSSSYDPTIDELRNFLQCNIWSVFNKWMNGARNTADNDAGNMFYNSAYPAPDDIFKRSDGIGKVPANWKLVAATP